MYEEEILTSQVSPLIARKSCPSPTIADMEKKHMACVPIVGKGVAENGINGKVGFTWKRRAHVVHAQPRFVSNLEQLGKKKKKRLMGE